MTMPQCGICYRDFSIENEEQTPKSLRCAHSVCTGCVRQILNNCQIVCPVCRQLTEVQGNNVANLPKNFALVEAINMMRTLTTKEVSYRMYGSELQDVQEKSDNCPPKCVQHPYNLAEFVCIESNCFSKNKLMCRTCEDFGVHKGHEKDLLISKAAEFRKTLESRRRQMEFNVHSFKFDENAIEDALIDDDLFFKHKMNCIKNRFDQIRHSVDEKEKKLTNDLTTRAKKIRELNKTQKDDLIRWRNSLHELIRQTEERINMNDFELYVAGTELGDEVWYSTQQEYLPADTKDMQIELPTFKFEEGQIAQSVAVAASSLEYTSSSTASSLNGASTAPPYRAYSFSPEGSPPGSVPEYQISRAYQPGIYSTAE